MTKQLLSLLGALALIAISSTNASTPESIVVWNQAIGTDRTGEGAFVSTVHAADPDGGTFTFSLVSGAGDDDNAKFGVAGNELRTASTLPEGEYTIRLNAADQEEASVEESFTISVVPGMVEPKVAAGDSHTVVLSSDGTVSTFGFGSGGRLGHGDTSNQLVPKPIEHDSLSGHTITKIAAGEDHTVLLSSDGTVFSFGRGFRAQLGHGDLTDRLVPTAIEHENLLGHRITDLAAGASYTVLLSSDGTVFTFGYGEFGKLGHGDTGSRLVPTSVEHENLFGHTIDAVVAGQDHTVLLALDGTVFTFGSGGRGRLGHGNTENRLVPTPIEHDSLSGHSIAGISGGNGHTVLLSSEGTVFTFGNNVDGRLGHGDTLDRLVPTPIEHENLSGHMITAADAGGFHTVLVSSDGTVFTFGYGLEGFLGHSDFSNRLVPTQIENEILSTYPITGVSAGRMHTVLLSSNGAVLTYGAGGGGRLGHGDAERRHIPIPIHDLNLIGNRILRLSTLGSGNGTILVNGDLPSGPPYLFVAEKGAGIDLEAAPDDGSFFERWVGDLGGIEYSSTITLDGDKDVSAVFGRASIFVWNQAIGVESTGAGALVSTLHAAGREDISFTFSLVSGEGDADNANFGIAGDELQTVTSLSEGEYSIRLRATDQNGGFFERVFVISVLRGVAKPKVAGGGEHTVLLSSDGTVFTIGKGRSGRLGHGDTSNRSVPEAIDHGNLFGHRITDIAAGDGHTLLLSSDGTVFTFGEGDYGKLGHGDEEDRLVPTLIDHVNLAPHTIVEVAAGGEHTVLRSSDGTIFTFGAGASGQLGFGDTENRLVPTPLRHENLFGYTITGIAAGEAHTVLLASEGGVFTFGFGIAGQLGHGDDNDRSVPTLLKHESIFDRRVNGIAAAGGHTVVLSTDGTVLTFGWGVDGQLGHGNTRNRFVPTPIAHENLSDHTITGVAAGQSHTILLTSNGAVITFGRGSLGRLGHGDTTERLIPTPLDQESLFGHAISGIAAGGAHTILLSSNGAVLTFGDGSRGLGHGDPLQRSLPTAIDDFNLMGMRTLILNAPGEGGGTFLLNGEPLPGPPYLYAAERGAELTLEAVPAENSFIETWRGDLSGTAAIHTVSLDTDISITVALGSEGIFLWNRTIGAERTGTNALVSSLHAPRPQGTSVVFELVSGEGDENNASFGIEDRELRIMDVLPIGEYSIRLRATYGGVRFVEKAFTISIVPGAVKPQVSAGDVHTVLLGSDGTVFTFGAGANGQLGHGDTEDRIVPTPIEHESLFGHTITAVAAGNRHTVLLSSDGTVFTFGHGGYGRLGHGNTESRSVPGAIKHENLSGQTITAVAAGDRHSVLLSASGDVFTFGRARTSHFYGGNPLGHGDAEDRFVPTPIEHEDLLGHTVTAVAAGGGHTILLSSDDTVFTFGASDSGALGHGDTVGRSVPTAIRPDNFGGRSIAGIAAGRRHSVLFSSDGTVFTFGNNGYGRLGHGDAENRLVPTPIEHVNLSGHTISAIAATSAHTILLSLDGKVFTFGRGEYGALGHGDTESQFVPESIEHENLSGETIIGVAGGGEHTVLSSSDGTVFTFGSGDFGKLGHGGTEDRFVPIPVKHLNLLEPVFEPLRFYGLMAEAGLTGAEAEPEAFPFGDGVENLLKYAFNMKISGADRRVMDAGVGETGGLPAVIYDKSQSGAVLVIEFVRRRNSDLTYTPKMSGDLATWHSVTAEPVVTEIDSEWERVKVEVPVEELPAARGFGKVEVTLP